MILVGRIRGCFGIRGFLKLELAGRSAEKAGELERVFIGHDESDAEACTVEDVRADDRRVVIKLESVDDRTAAERYRGLNVFVREEDAVPPPPGSWFIHDLLGCEVRTEKDEFVGTLTDVVNVSGRHLWAVNSGGRVIHIPAEKEFIAMVDIGARKIVIRAPEGLLEI